MLKRFHHWSLKTLGQIRILGTSFVRTAIKVRILPVLSGTAIKIRILPVLYGTAIKVRTRNTAWLTNNRPGKYLLLVQGSAATAALVSISCSWAGSLCTWPTKKSDEVVPHICAAPFISILAALAIVTNLFKKSVNVVSKKTCERQFEMCPTKFSILKQSNQTVDSKT